MPVNSPNNTAQDNFALFGGADNLFLFSLWKKHKITG